MVETFTQDLPHGIRLSCRACGPHDGPVLLFLHGFPEAAFVWDALLEHFGQQGWRCVAPNLRGFEHSSSPAEPSAYRAKHLVQDIQELATSLCTPTRPRLAALVAHDWGGAIAWNFANQHPAQLERLVIINAPHPGPFLRELRDNPQQIAASAYMNFLVRPDAEHQLADNDFQRLFDFLAPSRTPQRPAPPTWLTPEVKDQYRAVWSKGLTGGCNFYRASPLRPASAENPTVQTLSLPESMLHIEVPTLVLWGEADHALLPGLLQGLEHHVPQLTLHRHPSASHWIVHEAPDWVQSRIYEFLLATPSSR